MSILCSYATECQSHSVICLSIFGKYCMYSYGAGRALLRLAKLSFRSLCVAWFATNSSVLTRRFRYSPCALYHYTQLLQHNTTPQIKQIYQSFTMMVRDHFPNCSGIPPHKREQFLHLKGLTSPSSSLSRQYWMFAAEKIGMVDSEYGIIINEETQSEARNKPPFGTNTEESQAIRSAPVQLLVEPNEQRSISPYLYLLMSQAQIVHLLPSERVGKRKDAAVGLTGFGCIYCCKAGRLGFCRMFPLNKRSLPDKVNDLFAHMQRCPLCPTFTKTVLDSRRHEIARDQSYAERDREFVDRIWIKLGRDTNEAFQK